MWKHSYPKNGRSLKHGITSRQIQRQALWIETQIAPIHNIVDVVADSLVRFIKENGCGCQPIRDELLHDRKPFAEPKQLRLWNCFQRGWTANTDTSWQTMSNILQDVVAEYKIWHGIIHVGTQQNGKDCKWITARSLKKYSTAKKFETLAHAAIQYLILSSAVACACSKKRKPASCSPAHSRQFSKIAC